MSLVTIEDRQIQSMLRDQRYTAAIPCLAAGSNKLTQLSQSCSRCQRQKTKQKRAIYNAIRSCIAGLSGGQRDTLKSLLGATKVRIVRRNSQGKPVQVTF